MACVETCLSVCISGLRGCHFVFSTSAWVRHYSEYHHWKAWHQKPGSCILNFFAIYPYNLSNCSYNFGLGSCHFECPIFTWVGRFSEYHHSNARHRKYIIYILLLSGLQAEHSTSFKCMQKHSLTRQTMIYRYLHTSEDRNKVMERPIQVWVIHQKTPKISENI